MLQARVEVPEDYSVRVRSLRGCIALTQAQLAAKMGVTQQFVARLENSDVMMPSLRTLTKLAEAMGRRLQVSFV